MAAKTPRIGSLRHRIVIEQLVLTSDLQGGFDESWTTFATVWASVEPSSGSERFFSQQIQPVYDHVIMIRSLSGITTTMRVSYDSRIFQIHAVERTDGERGFYMKLRCKEGVGT